MRPVIGFVNQHGAIVWAKVTLPSQNDLLQCLIDEDANGRLEVSYIYL